MALSSSKKKLSAFIKKNDNNGDFFCLTCLHSFRAKNKLDSHKEVCEKIYFSKVVIPSEDTKILEFNQYQNLIKHYLLFIQILNV